MARRYRDYGCDPQEFDQNLLSAQHRSPALPDSIVDEFTGDADEPAAQVAAGSMAAVKPGVFNVVQPAQRSRRLQRVGIDEPVELRQANPRYVRQHLGVVGDTYELSTNSSARSRDT